MEEDLDFRTQKAYDAMYTGVPKSKTLLRIWRDVYGDDYPEGVEPFSFVTRTDLTHIAQYLQLNPGDTLVDLGCGRGGPGLWVARETGADLVGLDLSPVAVEQARQRIADFGLQEHARFLTADFCKTGLQDESCDGGMSIDMLWMIPDKTAALREAARILRSGARFAFTSWDKAGPPAVIQEQPNEADYRLLIERGGFVVEEYYEKPDWRRRQSAVYERELAEQATLIKEMGETAARPVINEAKESPEMLAHLRHVFVACRRI